MTGHSWTASQPTLTVERLLAALAGQPADATVEIDSGLLPEGVTRIRIRRPSEAGDSMAETAAYCECRSERPKAEARRAHVLQIHLPGTMGRNPVQRRARGSAQQQWAS